MSKQEAEVAFSAGNAAFVDEEYTLAIEVSSVNSIPASVSILPVTGDGYGWECDVCDVSSRPVEVLTVQLTLNLVCSSLYWPTALTLPFPRVSVDEMFSQESKSSSPARSITVPQSPTTISNRSITSSVRKPTSSSASTPV